MVLPPFGILFPLPPGSTAPEITPLPPMANAEFHRHAHGRWVVKAIRMAAAIILASAIGSVTHAQTFTNSANTGRAVQIMPAVGFAPDDYSPPKAESWPNWNSAEPTEPTHPERQRGIIRPLENRLSTSFAQTSASASPCTCGTDGHCSSHCSGTPSCHERHCGIIQPLENRLSTCFAQPCAGACTCGADSQCSTTPCCHTPVCHERHCGIIEPLHNMMSRKCGACEVHAKPVCCARHCGVILPLKDMLTEQCDGSGCGCRCGYACLSCAPLYAYFLDECGGCNAGSQEGCHGTEMQQGCCSSH